MAEIFTINGTSSSDGWFASGVLWPASVVSDTPSMFIQSRNVFGRNNLIFRADHSSGASAIQGPAFATSGWAFRIGNAARTAWVIDHTFAPASQGDVTFSAFNNRELFWYPVDLIPVATHPTLLVALLTSADIERIDADESLNKADSAGFILGLHASAPTVVINPVPAGNEGIPVALSAKVAGGAYDTLTRTWAVSGGSLFSASDANPVWIRPLVNSDEQHTVDLNLVAAADGTSHLVNGTSASVDAAQVSTLVRDGGTPPVTPGPTDPVEEPVANPDVTDTGWIEREETHASQEVIPLRPGIPYYIQVRSVDARYSEWGELHEVTMLPDAPAHLDWFKRTETSVQLAWADIPQATAYDLRKRIKNVAEWDAVVAETQLVHTFEGLTAGETYEFQIRARHEALATEWSPSLEVVMSAQIERVTDVRVARSQDIAIVRWDQFVVSEAVPAEGENDAMPAVYAFEYDIEGYRDDINGDPIFAVTLEATEYRFRTKPDQTYFLRVRAKNGEDDSTTDAVEPDTYTGWTQYTFET